MFPTVVDSMKFYGSIEKFSYVEIIFFLFVGFLQFVYIISFEWYFALTLTMIYLKTLQMVYFVWKEIILWLLATISREKQITTAFKRSETAQNEPY